MEVYPKYKGSSPIFFDDYIVYHLYSDKKIAIRDKTSSSLSTFPLTTLKDLYPDIAAEWEVWHFVGVVEGVLWISLNAIGYGMVLLGLEASSGKVKHFLHQVVAQNDLKYYPIIGLPLHTFTQYDKQKNILFGAAHYNYWEVDLSISAPEIKLWDFETVLKDKQAFFLHTLSPYAVTETHLFSASSVMRLGIPQVFAFNRDTHQIDWQYLFTEEAQTIPYFTPTKVEVTETHLFVLDSTGTLHIFEREA